MNLIKVKPHFSRVLRYFTSSFHKVLCKDRYILPSGSLFHPAAMCNVILHTGTTFFLKTFTHFHELKQVGTQWKTVMN